VSEEWLRDIQIYFVTRYIGIKKLQDRYRLCIDKDGDYVEKNVLKIAQLSAFCVNSLKTSWSSVVSMDSFILSCILYYFKIWLFCVGLNAALAL